MSFLCNNSKERGRTLGNNPIFRREAKGTLLSYHSPGRTVDNELILPFTPISGLLLLLGSGRPGKYLGAEGTDISMCLITDDLSLDSHTLKVHEPERWI